MAALTLVPVDPLALAPRSGTGGRPRMHRTPTPYPPRKPARKHTWLEETNTKVQHLLRRRSNANETEPGQVPEHDHHSPPQYPLFRLHRSHHTHSSSDYNSPAALASMDLPAPTPAVGGDGDVHSPAPLSAHDAVVAQLVKRPTPSRSATSASPAPSRPGNLARSISGSGTNTPERAASPRREPITAMLTGPLEPDGEKVMRALESHVEAVLAAQEEIGRAHLALEGIGGSWKETQPAARSDSREEMREGEEEAQAELERRAKGVEEIMAKLSHLSSTLREYHSLGTPSLVFPTNLMSPPKRATVPNMDTRRGPRVTIATPDPAGPLPTPKPADGLPVPRNRGAWPSPGKGEAEHRERGESKGEVQHRERQDDEEHGRRTEEKGAQREEERQVRRHPMNGLGELKPMTAIKRGVISDTAVESPIEMDAASKRPW